MANKNDFSPEEWTKVLESIMVAGIAVSAADPSGLWGTLKEAAASSSALAAAKRDPKSNELIKAAIADFETSEGRSNIQNAMRKRFSQGVLNPTIIPFTGSVHKAANLDGTGIIPHIENIDLA